MMIVQLAHGMLLALSYDFDSVFQVRFSATNPVPNDSEIIFYDRGVLEEVGIGTFGRSLSGWCTVSEFLCG